MKTSETQGAIVTALLACQAEFPKIAKTKRGQAGNREFMYAPMEDVLDAILPVLHKYELLLTHAPDGHELVTRLDHSCGEWRECRSPINKEHANLQSLGIEKTYLRRQDAQLLLGIITEDDTDGVGDKQKRTGVDNTKHLNANGTEQLEHGATNPKRIAFEALPVEVQDSFRKAAPQAEAAMPDVQKAIETAAMAIDDWDREDAPYGRSDLTAGFHYLLSSKTRSAMKRHVQIEGIKAGSKASNARVTQ